MTRADLLKKIADHHFGLAELYSELAESSAVSTAAPAAESVPPSAPADDLPEFPPMEGLPKRPEPTGDQGSLAVCPKHHKPYVEGTYGPYCTSPTDDPAWANKKGYCRITPKNVANYLRMQAA